MSFALRAIARASIAVTQIERERDRQRESERERKSARVCARHVKSEFGGTDILTEPFRAWCWWWCSTAAAAAAAAAAGGNALSPHP